MNEPKIKQKAGCDLCKIAIPSRTGAKKMDMFDAEGEKVDEYNPNAKWNPAGVKQC
jgi:hypothetical protein